MWTCVLLLQRWHCRWQCTSCMQIMLMHSEQQMSEQFTCSNQVAPWNDAKAMYSTVMAIQIILLIVLVVPAIHPFHLAAIL